MRLAGESELRRGGGVEQPREFASHRGDSADGQRFGFCASVQHGPHEGGFLFAGRQHDDAVGAVDQRERHREASVDGIAPTGGDEKPDVFVDGGLAGEERGGVAVPAHTQQHEVEMRDRVRRPRRYCGADDIFVGGRGGVEIQRIALGAVDLARRHARGLEERFADGAVVGVMVAGRNRALVAEEEVDVVPRQRERGETSVGGAGRGAARERDRGAAIGMDRVEQRLRDEAGSGRGEGVVIGADNGAG